jgi:hypothetical protein
MKKTVFSTCATVALALSALGIFPLILKAAPTPKSTITKRKKKAQKTQSHLQKKTDQFLIEHISENQMQIFLKKHSSFFDKNKLCIPESLFSKHSKKIKHQKTTHPEENFFYLQLWKDRFDLPNIESQKFCLCPTLHIPQIDLHYKSWIDCLSTISLPIGWHLTQFSTDTYPSPFCFQQCLKTTPSLLNSVDHISLPESILHEFRDNSTFSIVVAKQTAFLDEKKCPLKNLPLFIMPFFSSAHALSFVHPHPCFQRIVVPENQMPALRFFHLIHSHAHECILQKPGIKQCIKKIFITHNPKLEHLVLEHIPHIQTLVLMNNPHLKTISCSALQKIDHLILTDHQLSQAQSKALLDLTPNKNSEHPTSDSVKIFFNQGGMIWKNVSSIVLSESTEKDCALFEYLQINHTFSSKRKICTNIIQLNITSMPVLQSITVFGHCHNLLSLHVHNCPQLKTIQVTNTTLMQLSVYNVLEQCALHLKQNPFLFDVSFHPSSQSPLIPLSMTPPGKGKSQKHTPKKKSNFEMPVL